MYLIPLQRLHYVFQYLNVISGIWPPSCAAVHVTRSLNKTFTNFCLNYACHISFDRSLRVHSEIDSVCLSVPRSSNEKQDFIILPNLSCYTSMDLPQRALQIF